VFTVDERERLRARVVAYAEADALVTGLAFTGSAADADGDRWSDTDVVLAVRGDVGAAVARWTAWLGEEFGVLHHWDLAAGPGVIRVFLLPGWLELDLTFAPEAEFGARGPQWRTVFGEARPLDAFPAPDRGTLAGLIWHHALHARICVRRGRWWQAEHWISALRDHVITLACLRLGIPCAYAKGAHLLPYEMTRSLEATLIRSVTEPELERAFAAAVGVALGEVAHVDSALAGRLRPMLADLVAAGAGEAGRDAVRPGRRGPDAVVRDGG
jgi:hypothetical protein